MEWASKILTGAKNIHEYAIDALAKTDLSYKIIDANLAYQEMLGYTLEELRQMTIHDITPQKWSHLTSEDSTNYLLNTGYTPLIEKEYRRKDGKIISVELRVIVRTNENDEPIGFWSIIRDITKSKQTEERLEEGKNLLDECQQIARIGSWEYDLITKVFIWTDQMFLLFGYKPQEFTPTWDHVAERIHPEDLEAVVIHWKKSMAMNDFPAIEFRIVTNAGQVRWMSAVGRVLYDIVGNVESIIGTLQDFTDRKEREEENAGLSAQLLQSQKLEVVGQIASGISHDFSNLLQIIESNVHLLMMALPENSEHQKILKRVENISISARDMIYQITNFSGQMESKLDIINPNQMIEDIRHFVERAVAKTVRLTYSLDSPTDNINADKNQLTQALLNLAINANHAMPRGGEIDIGVKNVIIDETYCKRHLGAIPGKYVQLKVADNGAGMDRETLDRIFEPFFTTKDPSQGTGLGLTMVLRIVKNHGGYIECHSEKGQGTCVTIYFPVFDPEASAGASRDD